MLVAAALDEELSELDAIVAVRRLWKELGLLFPDEVEQTPVEEFEDQDDAPRFGITSHNDVLQNLVHRFFECLFSVSTGSLEREV